MRVNKAFTLELLKTKTPKYTFDRSILFRSIRVDKGQAWKILSKLKV